MKFWDFQASSSLALGDGRVLSACERCQLDRPERKLPGNAACESCRVELKVENSDAARIFLTVRGQKLSNGDLNHLAVWAAIDSYGIRDRAGTFDKVMVTFYHFLNRGRVDDGDTAEI